jgi:hypothetical protein
MNMLDRVPNMTFHQKPDSGRSHAYYGISTRGIAETLRFGATIMEQADVEAPRVHDVAMVLNDNDRTIDEATALRLADRWRAADGVTTTRFTFERGLALPHDLIDITQPCGMTAVVYPILIALMEKTEPSVPKVDEPRCGERTTK